MDEEMSDGHLPSTQTFTKDARRCLKAFGVKQPKRLCEMVATLSADQPNPDTTYREILYEVIGHLDPSDPQHVTEKTVLADLKKGRLGWNATLFASRRAELTHAQEVIANADLNVKEGEFTCSKCKSRRVVYDQLQTRKADEGVTTFLRCIDCGKKWKIA